MRVITHDAARAAISASFTHLALALPGAYPDHAQWAPLDTDVGLRRPRPRRQRG